MFLTVTANKRWEVETLDVTTAFLQGSELERGIHVFPQREAKMSGMLCRMMKAVYALVYAFREFWQKVMDILLQLGCSQLVEVLHLTKIS